MLYSQHHPNIMDAFRPWKPTQPGALFSGIFSLAPQLSRNISVRETRAARGSQVVTLDQLSMLSYVHIYIYIIIYIYISYYKLLVLSCHVLFLGFLWIFILGEKSKQKPVVSARHPMLDTLPATMSVIDCSTSGPCWNFGTFICQHKD